MCAWVLSLFLASGQVEAAEQIWGISGVLDDLQALDYSDDGPAALSDTIPLEADYWLQGITAVDAHTVLVLDDTDIWAVDTDTGTNTLLGTTPRGYAALAADPL